MQEHTEQGAQDSLLQLVGKALKQVLIVAEQEQTDKQQVLPADLMQHLRECVRCAAHHEAIEQEVQEQRRLLGEADSEQVFVALAVRWAQTQMQSVGTGTKFDGRTYPASVPVSVQIEAYKKYVGVKDFAPKPKPQQQAQQVPQTQPPAAALAAKGEEGTTNDKQKPQQQPAVLHTPRTDATKREGVTQELARILEKGNIGEALQETKEALRFISQTVSSESLRKNTKRSRIELLNAVGVYLGVLDSAGIGTGSLLPAGVKSGRELSVLIWDAVQEYIQERNKITEQNLYV